MKFMNYVTFAGRCSREIVVGTAIATKDAAVAAVVAYDATARKRAEAFIMAELQRLDSPMYGVDRDVIDKAVSAAVDAASYAVMIAG